MSSSGSRYQTGASSIESLLGELGIKYDISGDEAYSSCPFHYPDRHASWYVNIRSGLHHCFSCGAKGNLAHLVSFVKNISYPEAVIYVNEIIGWARADRWREDYESSSYAPPAYRISETDLAMFDSPPVDYMEQRDLREEYVKLFGVKWNTENKSWILPIRDPYTFDLWGWQEKLADGRGFSNNPRGIKKSKTLFGIDVATDGGTIILVESPLDAVRVSSFGRGTGLACSGLQVSDIQLSFVFERSERVVLALDNDTPGIRDTARICSEYKGRPLWIYDYGMSKAKDPGEQTDEEIIWSLDNMRSGLRCLAEHEKKLKNLQR